MREDILVVFCGLVRGKGNEGREKARKQDAKRATTKRSRRWTRSECLWICATHTTILGVGNISDSGDEPKIYQDT